MSYEIEEIIESLKESFSQKGLTQENLDELLETYVDNVKESIKNLNNRKNNPDSPLVLWRPEVHFTYDPKTRQALVEPMELINQLALHKALKELQDEEGYEVAHLIEEDSHDLKHLINYVREQQNYGNVYYIYVLDWMDKNGITPIAADESQETRIFDEDGNLIANNQAYQEQYANDTKQNRLEERTMGVYNKAEEIAGQMSLDNKGKQILLVTMGEHHTNSVHFLKVEENIAEIFWDNGGYQDQIREVLNGKNINTAIRDEKYKENKIKIEEINQRFEEDFNSIYISEHIMLDMDFSYLSRFSSNKEQLKQTQRAIERLVEQQNITPENIIQRTF